MDKPCVVIDLNAYKLTRRKIRLKFPANDNAGKYRNIPALYFYNEYGIILLVNENGQLVESKFQSSLFDNEGYREVL